MAGIGAEIAVSEEGSQGGASEFQQWSEERRNYYLNILSQHQNTINEFYNYTISSQNNNSIASTAANRKQEMNKLIRDNLKQAIHRSIKGGADIAPKGLINQIKAIQDEVSKNDIINNLKNIRESIYSISKQEEFKKEALKIMQTITQLQEELTGIVEEIGITFSEGGFVKLIRIPMDQFLGEMQSAISVSQVSTLGVTSGDPWKLDIDFNSSVIQQLKNINKQNGGTGEGINLITEKEFFEDFMLREDDDYHVIQTGFVAEALARANILNQSYKYSQDNLAWYKGFDIYGKDINGNTVGVSMKNAMFGSPTLLRINSLHTALNKLIKALSSKKSAEEVASYIKERIYTGITGLDNNVEETIEQKVFSELGI